MADEALEALEKEPFQGNWGPWRSKLDHLFDALSAIGPDLYPYLRADTREAVRTRQHFVEFTQNSTRATLIIVNNVPATIIQRVSSERLMNPPLLLDSLEALAQPFRFMALSPELRNCVYDFMEDLHSDLYISLTPRPGCTVRRGLKQRGYEHGPTGFTSCPAITQASTRLRAETRSIFLHGKDCSFDFSSYLEPGTIDLAIARDILEDWMDLTGCAISDLGRIRVIGTHLDFFLMPSDTYGVECQVCPGFSDRFEPNFDTVIAPRLFKAKLHARAGSEEGLVGRFLVNNVDIWVMNPYNFTRLVR